MAPIREQPEDVRPRDFSDPMHVAVRVMELERDTRLVEQSVSLGMKTVFDQLASVQGDLRDLDRSVHGIAAQAHEIQSHSTGLDRLAKSIEKHVEQQELRWSKHEEENQRVADRVTLWRGVVIGFGILAALLVTGTGFFIKSQFDDATQARVRIDSRLDRLESHQP
jgi:vacuolar-type H+-ATPase subunit I/STV1